MVVPFSVIFLIFEACSIASASNSLRNLIKENVVTSFIQNCQEMPPQRKQMFEENVLRYFCGFPFSKCRDSPSQETKNYNQTTNKIKLVMFRIM